jgi:hypothetical protein
MSSRRAFASKGSIRVVSYVAGVLVWTVPFTAQAASHHDATSPVGALRGVNVRAVIVVRPGATQSPRAT